MRDVSVFDACVMQLLRGVFQSPLLYGVRTMGVGHLGGRRLGVARRVEHEPRVPPERAGRSRSWRWRRPPERGTCSWIVARAPERRRAFYVRFLTKGGGDLGLLRRHDRRLEVRGALDGRVHVCRQRSVKIEGDRCFVLLCEY